MLWRRRRREERPYDHRLSRLPSPIQVRRIQARRAAQGQDPVREVRSDDRDREPAPRRDDSSPGDAPPASRAYAPGAPSGAGARHRHRPPRHSLVHGGAGRSDHHRQGPSQDGRAGAAQGQALLAGRHPGGGDGTDPSDQQDPHDHRPHGSGPEPRRRRGLPPARGGGDPGRERDPTRPGVDQRHLHRARPHPAARPQQPHGVPDRQPRLDVHRHRRGMTPFGDLDPDAFRSEAHRLVDWISGYLEGAERYPVLSRVRPGEIRRALPPAPPARAEPLEAILADVERVIVPGLTHWNHPGFFAYFANSSPGPAVLAEALAAAFNANAMLWKTAPAATELELVVLDWLRQMLGLPEGLFGVIQDTASTSTLVALAAAREAVRGIDVRRRGLVGQARLRMYASEQAHSSVEKAGIVLGIGQDGYRSVPVDAEYRMDPLALARIVAEDRAAGWTPFAVTATVGTTSTTSVDPVPAIAEICEQERLWLHVDTAYAGSAAVVPEL